MDDPEEEPPEEDDPDPEDPDEPEPEEEPPDEPEPEDEEPPAKIRFTSACTAAGSCPAARSRCTRSAPLPNRPSIT